MDNVDIVDVLLDLIIDKIKEHPTVFTTGITLNERFSQNGRQCNFAGDHCSPLNRCVGLRRKLDFDGRRCLNVHDQFTCYKRDDLRPFHRRPTEMENGFKPKFRQLDCKRTVLRSDPINQKSDGMFDNSKTVKQIEVLDSTKSKPLIWRRAYPYRCRRFARFSEFGNGCLHRRFERTSSSFDDNGEYVYNYCPASVYKRKRGRLPAKQELDDELDRYMSEIKLKEPVTDIVEDVDSFVKEYMMETEKCLNQVQTSEVW